MTRWADLLADERMIAALDRADADGSRSAAVSSDQRSPKHKWSNAFADACAQMVASEVATCPVFEKLDVLPKATGPAEPITFPVGGERKRIDVAVSEHAHGLRLGVSLKGMNFRDRSGWQFDKNLTGRTYELENEVRAVHRALPRAFLVGLYFLPLAATDDKKGTGASSFARTVEHLRKRTGRVDPESPTQMERLDMAAVALYVPGDDERFEYTQGKGSSKETKEFRYRDELPRGVVRYFDVTTNPPERGRPRVETTLDLPGFVATMAAAYERFTLGAPIIWADPE